MTHFAKDAEMILRTILSRAREKDASIPPIAASGTRKCSITRYLDVSGRDTRSPRDGIKVRDARTARVPRRSPSPLAVSLPMRPQHPRAAPITTPQEEVRSLPPPLPGQGGGRGTRFTRANDTCSRCRCTRTPIAESGERIVASDDALNV